MTQATYLVEGMSCGHCVRAVSEEVGKLDGVTAVDVDLASGRVTIDADPALDTDAVRAAVEEAGYSLR
jgi:copper ion binding protein